MSTKSTLNDVHRGIVEAMAIPAQVEERDGRRVARFGSVLPIHVCDPKEISSRSESTHHYCDIFTEDLMAPLEELAYVRLDENKAEKVFINRHKKMLIHSGDGRLATWRCAPTFESANDFIAGTPIVNKAGSLVSVVTARRGNHYAVSTFEGECGFVETSVPWRVEEGEDELQYGPKRTGRGAVAYVDANAPVVPVLRRGHTATIALLAHNGAVLSHTCLQGVLATDVHYL